MCESRQRSFRLLLWASLLFGGVLSMGACAGEPPSAAGLLCVAGADEDDGGCWGEGIICSEGYCRETGKSCPQTCQTHTDCRAAETCGRRIACIKNKCEEPGVDPDCRDACSEDNQCKGCSEGRTSCIQGKCTKPGGSCPSSCKESKDCKDCGGGRLLCDQGACIKPDCPSKAPPCHAIGGDVLCKLTCGQGWSCEAQKCTQKGPTCPASCNTKADCAGCTDGRTGCHANACTEPLNDHAWTCPNGDECAQGWRCGGQGPTDRVCTKSCQSDADCTPKGPQTYTYKCLGPKNMPNNKTCHLTCAGSCPGGYQCCSPTSGPHKFCNPSCK